MRYITFKRFKRKGIGGNFNLPYGTLLEKREDGILYFDNKPVCVARSAASHAHFTQNEDGEGQKRGELTQTIIKVLEPQPGETKEDRNKRWEPTWQDATAKKYRRKDSISHWLWDDNFYNAPVSDLEHILSVAKGE